MLLIGYFMPLINDLMTENAKNKPIRQFIRRKTNSSQTNSTNAGFLCCFTILFADVLTDEQCSWSDARATDRPWHMEGSAPSHRL